MIKIDFWSNRANDREQMVSSYYAEMMRDRVPSKVKALDDWCSQYLPKTKENNKEYLCSFEMVVKASPERLLQYKKHLDTNYDVDAIMDILKERKGRCYTETGLYNSMQYGKDHEKAKMILLKGLGITVCPYCNRNYIYSDDEMVSCELDHFIPKSKYPIFAVSFYNLIPVCPTCNHKKGETEFKYYPHHMEKVTDELLHFEYDILGSDYLRNVDSLNLRLETLDVDFDRQVEALKLRNLYVFHKDIVQDILRKREAFNDIYIQGLLKEFPDLFANEMEVKELLFGTPLESKGYGKRPLAKLTADIVKEVDSL